MSVDPRQALTGLDGLDEQPAGPPQPRRGVHSLRLAPEATERIRAEIARAGGREVCFLARVEAGSVVVEPRAVARGNHAAVLAAARDEPVGGVMIHNHPSGVLAPSDPDLEVAARLWEQGLGTAITNNEATELYVVVEPPEPRERVPLELDELEALVRPGGALAERHPQYEDRAGQRAMLREVAERYNEGGVLLVEAGTGTGKSVAYLLPAAKWALENEERTVVSTATINLQEQLVTNDLPLVARLLGAEQARLGAVPGGSTSGDGDRAASHRDGGAPTLSWALVKGRGNYISIRRLEMAISGAAELFETDRSRELEALRAWIETTEDGSLSDLEALPSEDVWDEVRSDPDVCLRARCPHFQTCFYQRSRRRAAAARILIVNHHLLFTDLAVRRATQNWTSAAVLPPYRHVIVDEAHNVEDAATSHLGVEVTRSGMYRTLARLDRRGKGVLSAVQDSLGSGEGALRELRRHIEEQVRPAVDAGRAHLEAFIERMEPLVGGYAAADGEAVRIVDSGGATEGRGMPDPLGDSRVAEAFRALMASWGRLERELARLRERVESNEELEERVGARLLDVRSAERRIAAAQVALKLVLEPGDAAARFVRWVELRGRGRRRNLALAAAPIELGPELRDALWARAETVVLASATLTTRKRFEFVRERLGVDADGLLDLEQPPTVMERVVPSPFDFASQSLLAVPSDLPPATQSAAFDEATADVVAELAEQTQGGLFVLFTSFRALTNVAEHLRARDIEARWPLFVHGEAERARLLQGFVDHGNAILLGTASFWEGVDVPGDPLRGLVIQKLPFRVPTEPVVAARVEALERKGGNAFWGYMLPLAALRLKQGFGRLVRRRTDRGVVLILDDRIISRRYGIYLRDSLPEAPFVKGPWADVSRRIRDFYHAPEPGATISLT